MNVQIQLTEDVLHIQVMGSTDNRCVPSYSQCGNGFIGAMQVNRSHGDGSRQHHTSLSQQSRRFALQIRVDGHISPCLNCGNLAELLHPCCGIDGLALFYKTCGDFSIWQVLNRQLVLAERQDRSVNVRGIQSIGQIQQVLRKFHALGVGQRIVRHIIQICPIVLITHQKMTTEGRITELVRDTIPSGHIIFAGANNIIVRVADGHCAQLDLLFFRYLRIVGGNQQSQPILNYIAGILIIILIFVIVREGKRRHDGIIQTSQLSLCFDGSHSVEVGFITENTTSPDNSPIRRKLQPAFQLAECINMRMGGRHVKRHAPCLIHGKMCAHVVNVPVR